LERIQGVRAGCGATPKNSLNLKGTDFQSGGSVVEEEKWRNGTFSAGGGQCRRSYLDKTAIIRVRATGK